MITFIAQQEPGTLAKTDRKRRSKLTTQINESRLMETLRLENVSKSFDKVEAVKSLSFSVPPGTMYGFLGPNGAGKTTTLRMIMEIILPDAGAIHLLGQPNALHLRDRVGYLPEERGLYRKMKVHEALHFFAELKGMRKKDYLAKVNIWLDRFDLGPARDKKVEELSKGNQQKLQFLTTVLHEPDLVILDEPFMGLDPLNVQLVKDVMLEQKKRGAAIVFSTHQMHEAERLCDAICLINRGEKMLDGNLAGIKKSYGPKNIILSYTGKSDYLQDQTLVEHYNDYGQYVEVTLQKGVAPRAFLYRALEHAEITRFEVAEPSLHEIFLSVVKSN